MSDDRYDVEDDRADRDLRVQLVTSWQTACGIAEHSALLVEAAQAADPNIQVVPDATALDPNAQSIRAFLYDGATSGVDLIHLNYQAALLSRWTPETIRAVQRAGIKVLVTYHDTGVPNSDQCKAIIDAADGAVVHEPFTDLPEGKTHYWRMGVPPPPINPLKLHVYRDSDKEQDRLRYSGVKAYPDQPVLGTVGFPSAYKNYDELARITAVAGWGLLLIAPTATQAQIDEWTFFNPNCLVYPEFVHAHRVVRLLHACDATAFCYTCAFAGQSGAVLQGIAALKPVIAFSHCRQFRALFQDDLGSGAIRWCESWEDVMVELTELPIQRVDPGMVALAAQESWAGLGRKYAQLYRGLVG